MEILMPGSIFDKSVESGSADLPISKTQTQIFSDELCEILKSIYFGKHLQKTATELQRLCVDQNLLIHVF